MTSFHEGNSSPIEKIEADLAVYREKRDAAEKGLKELEDQLEALEEEKRQVFVQLRKLAKT